MCIFAAVLVQMDYDAQVLSSVHVEVFHEIYHDSKALAIDSFDVDLVEIANEGWRGGGYAVLLVRLSDVGEGCQVGINALVLHHLG